MSYVTFWVTFRKDRRSGQIIPEKVTKTRVALPRGLGAVGIRFRAEIPDFVFEPLDLIAETVVPAEAVEPVIRLEAVGPVVEPKGE